ncbi:crotonase/enoyl-CoA hydratase family protein [Tenacibaculum sp. 190524A02b]|uniref:crotonase/enoyl-CoA hydratase family protein n=1 Tax=Tenacibaculum vairaonense TaxID=3137860 RepID=UPI0031FB5B10
MLNQYKNIEVDYYPEYELVNWKIKTEGIPNFCIEALREFKRFSEDLKMMFSDNMYPLKYIVSSSTHNEVYNLGGDLPYFYESIKSKNKEKLKEYAHLCIDAIYNIYKSFDLPIINISLVEGNAYGGGFECVLAHDVILANKKAKFCLPENKFNLFPGMGAYSFLCRKLNIKKATEILYSGAIYKARELEESGLIDTIFQEEESIKAIIKYINKNKSSFNFQYCHYQSIKKVFPLQKGELLDITDLWVNTCLNMESKDLRRMELIINAQKRKLKITA